MGNRLSKIYTRTGDDGTSALADGKRICKSAMVFEVMGDVDELNSHIGMIKCLCQNQLNNNLNHQDLPDTVDGSDLLNSLTIIQHLLFNIGGELAMPNMGYEGVKDAHVSWLETAIDNMNANLAPLKDFILPAGNQLMCQIHIARSVCRRAERHASKLNIDLKTDVNTDLKHEPETDSNAASARLTDASQRFLNRLSDWLFVVARFVTPTAQQQEVLWNKQVLADGIE